jgi:4-hydroxymandelate oxidase
MTLELIRWLGDISPLPVVVKGVLRGEDAAAAAALPHVRGVIVSNHGGRQLDNTVPPLSALPEVSARPLLLPSCCPTCVE